MIEQIKKGVLTGIGLGLMTNEKILEFARKSAEEAKLSTEEARKLADELLEVVLEAHERGVEFRILLDGVGSKNFLRG